MTGIHRRTRLGLASLMLLGLATSPVSAQWAVVEVNSAAQLIQGGRSLIYQYNILLANIEQIANQVKNLQRIDDTMMMIGAIQRTATELNTIFNTATRMSFDLTRGQADFTRLYRQPPGALSAQGLLAYRQQLNAAKLDVAGMATNMQSIQGGVATSFANLAKLLGAVWTASGALDMAQLHAQQNALMLQSQQAHQAMDATHQRLVGMDMAEKAAWEQAAIDTYTQVTTMAPTGNWQDGPQLSYTVQGNPD